MDQTNRLTINHTTAMNTPSPDQQTACIKIASDQILNLIGNTPSRELTDANLGNLAPEIQRIIRAALAKHMPLVTAHLMFRALSKNVGHDTDKDYPQRLADSVNEDLRACLVPEAAVVGEEWEYFTGQDANDAGWSRQEGMQMCNPLGTWDRVGTDSSPFAEGVRYRRLKQAESPTQDESPKKPLPFDPKKDWSEDFSHENGNYNCHCTICGCTFVGHKRRVVCKECATHQPPQAATDGATAHKAEVAELKLELSQARFHLEQERKRHFQNVETEREIKSKQREQIADLQSQLTTAQKDHQAACNTITSLDARYSEKGNYILD